MASLSDTFLTTSSPPPAMSVPLTQPPVTTTNSTSTGFDGKKLAINIGWVCLAILAIAGTVMLILGMSGCSPRSSFASLQGRNDQGDHQSNRSAGAQASASGHEPLVMPANFADAMKVSAPKVTAIRPDGFDTWPSEIKAKFLSGINPVWARNGRKGKFYGDPQAPWNPDPAIPADVLAALQQGHARR